MANPKIVCSVLGCKKWTRKFPPGTIIICYRHFMSVPKPWRRAFNRSDRRLKSGDTRTCPEAKHRLFMAIVRRASEIQVGIK